MAYPTYPAAPAHPPRPATVTVSSYLLWVTAALSVIGAVLTLSMVGRIAGAYRDLYAGTPVEGTEAVIVGASVLAVVINILFAAGLAILAIFNNRGRQGARVTTWVVGCFALCCGGLALGGAALSSMGSMNLDSSATTGGPSASEVERRLSEVLPSWYEPVSTALSALSLLAIVGAIILLALPASNAYFRKPAAAGWDPSVPYQYPAPGQQPPYPTYPPSAQPWSPPPPPSGGAPLPPPAGGGSPLPPPSGGPPLPPPPGGSAPGEPGQQHGPSSDPWGRPPDDRRPPSDPTS